MSSSLSTYTPTPEIRLGGSANERLSSLLQSATVAESVSGLARCEIRLDNWDATADGPGYAFVDRNAFDFGTSFEIVVGPPDERASIFTGRLTGIEAEYPADGGPTLTLLCEDALQDLRMTRRTRTFEDHSDADVISSIASDHGLTPEVDLDGPTHAALCQLNRSDLSFIRDRALPYGADVWLEGTTLHVGHREDDPIVLRLGRELLSFRVLADLAMQADEQRVAGWDPDAKGAVLEVADQSCLGAGLGSDAGGGKLLAELFGTRPATATLHRAVTSPEARAVAEGLYRDRARRFVTGAGRTDGIAGLRAGRSVDITGIGKMFNGRYRLTTVVHRYDHGGTGYRSEIELERTGIAP